MGRAATAPGTVAAMPTARTAARPLAENVCLGIIAGGAQHGWAVGGELAPEGTIGRIWSLSRPLTYRAIDALLEARLIQRTGTAPGRGRDRRLLRLTAAGRRSLDRWLEAPIEHVRDVRTELLVKLTLNDQLGRDTADLLERQRQQLQPLLDALVAADERASDQGDDWVVRWRAENARAVQRFLDRAGGPRRTRRRPAPLRISARNQLEATVVTIDRGDVMATVVVALPSGEELTAAITAGAVDDLELAPGDPVVAIVKSTEVLLARR